ncbi:hypothetical protein [Halorubrum tebenquichense]|uniref:hypothetical protein n=1 Tax=Halorubrum tebenquichense TaxID=119434 RepID=UPI0012678EF8|nr:hypothetical protein [Halorubrum tebenquichense]
MDRRQYISIAGVGTLSTLAGCSGDPSGIISDDSEGSDSSENPESEDGDQSGNDGSENEDQSTSGSSDDIIQTTLEGSGSSLREVSIENNGVVVLSADTDSNLEILFLNASEEVVDSVEVELDQPFRRTIVELPAEEYAVDIQTEGDWSITIEQHPVVSPEEVDTSFPVEIEANSEEVFGPFLLEGFYRPVVQTNGSMAVRFFDQNGVPVNDPIIFEASSDYDESPVELDPINIDSVCWMNGILAEARYRDEEDELYYNLRLEEPE